MAHQRSFAWTRSSPRSVSALAGGQHAPAALLIACLLALLLPLQALAKAPPPADGFADRKAVLTWINAYRFNPQPQRLGDAVQAMSRFGLLRDPDAAGVHVGFVAGVLASNQTRARSLINKLFPLPPPEQFIVIKGIAYSGLPEWRGLLRGVIERMPARRVQIERLLFSKEPATLDRLKLQSGPAALDTLWGLYFATGLYHPIQRMITVLPWTEETADVNKLTIGSMAKWTLATNASRDKALLDLARTELEYATPAVRKPLREVIRAAQTFETQKIRKTALAAIAKVKANPTPKQSKWLRAAKIGQTVLALGCIAASVTGQVELGVPCVLTGALSSAALKLLTGPLATSSGFAKP